MNEALEELRAFYLKKHVPVMRPETARLLASVTKDVRPKQVLEIGTCVGLGTILLLLSGAEKVTSIEIDEERYYNAKENIRKFGLSDRCELVLGDCKEIVPMMENNRYDMILLDGPKTYYRDFLPYIKKMLLTGGVVFADDVLLHGWVEGKDLPERKHRTNVLALRQFIEEVKGDEEYDCKEYPIEDGVLLFQRREGAKDQFA